MPSNFSPRKPTVPQDWETVPIGEVAKKIGGKKPDSVVDEYEPGYEKYITTEAYEGEVSSYADPTSGKECKNNDVLLVWDGSVGKVMFGFEGIIGSTLAALRFDQDRVDPRFAYYYLHNVEDKIASLAEGTTILHLPRDFMSIFEMPLPSLQEQQRIAEFLQRIENFQEKASDVHNKTESIKNTAINNLIQSGITDCETKQVTIGPRKETIPSHWDIKSIDTISLSGKEGLRGGPPGGKIKNEYRTSSGYKIYAQENIIERDFKKRGDYIPVERYRKVESASVTPGDILITTEGSIGRSAVLPEDAQDGIVSNHLARLRVDESRNIPQYIAEMIDSSSIVNAQIQSLSNNSGRPGINLKIIRQLQIPVPPLSEQREIVDILRSIDKKIQLENNTSDHLLSTYHALQGKLTKGELRFEDVQ